MKILVLGGTGAMGTPLVSLLCKNNHEVYVTSRSKKESNGNLHYLQGNAHEDDFLENILEEFYDVIVDFMSYKSDNLKRRLPLLLSKTNQYIFLSSSRVYAQTKEKITENSPRLLDSQIDEEYLKTDEYALAKAREEDLLKNSGKTNWTIIRPYITYNSQRLQLGVYEKENWLYRALHGRTIVFPKDIAERTTSLTYGGDVARVIVKLIGNPSAYGEEFHIVTEQTATWREILEIYLNVIEEYTGKRPKVMFVENSEGLQKVWNSAQIKYDRLYDRKFSNKKITSVCGEIQYKDLKEGLRECLEEFLKNPKWLTLNYRYETWADKVTKEHTPLSEIYGVKNKLRYIKHRYIDRN